MLRVLPPGPRLRLRQVKRAALGQPPVPVAGSSSAASPAAEHPVQRPGPSADDRNRKEKPAPPPPRVLPGASTQGPIAAPPGSDRTATRRSHVFATRGPSAAMLEIGPAHNAILPKREGFQTRTVDYLDRAGLIDKYKAQTHYLPENIEEVDYVLEPGAAMADVIQERFDLVLASHVLEHTTSLIDFINECDRLLAPEGVLALVVPDHRYCFDRFRERSSIAAVIDASLHSHPVHTVGTLTEFSLYAARHRGSTSWAPGHRGRYSLVHDPAAVVRNAAKATTGDYVDVHHWVFSPAHLRLMLHDLADLGYIRLREAYWYDTIGHEFFLNLTAESAGSGLTREQLIDLADEERRHLDVPEWESQED